MHRKIIFALLALSLAGGVAAADPRRGERSHRARDHHAQRSDAHHRRDDHHTPRGQHAPRHHDAHRRVVRHRHYDYHHRPANIAETYAPVAGYAWISGQWTWNGYEWIWQSGYYQRDRSHTPHEHHSSVDYYNGY